MNPVVVCSVQSGVPSDRGFEVSSPYTEYIMFSSYTPRTLGDPPTSIRFLYLSLTPLSHSLTLPPSFRSVAHHQLTETYEVGRLEFLVDS